MIDELQYMLVTDRIMKQSLVLEKIITTNHKNACGP